MAPVSCTQTAGASVASVSEDEEEAGSESARAHSLVQTPPINVLIKSAGPGRLAMLAVTPPLTHQLALR